MKLVPMLVMNEKE